jgi:hypothetical protein
MDDVGLKAKIREVFFEFLFPEDKAAVKQASG